MGDSRSEPSMEDILASIKRIIADDSQVVHAPVSRVESVAASANVEPIRFTPLQLVESEREDAEFAVPPKEEVLELTQPMDISDAQPTAPVETSADPLDLGTVAEVAATVPPVARNAAAPATAAPIVSDDAAIASRQSLAALSALLVKPEDERENTLEGLVREMLRPMMKEWLDQRLPDLVERLVEREIARITGRLP